MTKTTTIWPMLNYNDARAAIDFLEKALGFTISFVVPDDDDLSVVHHAELHWPEGGGVMLASANRDGMPFSQRPTGTAATYIVTDSPDQIHDRAIAAGAQIYSPLKDEDYGSRGFSVRDLEGNIWDFGTYAGHA